jgi:hypothetical protein
MTIEIIENHTPHDRPPTPVRTVVLAVAGIALAAGTGVGITQLLSPTGPSPAPSEPRAPITEGARDSWEGRIQPAPVPGTEHGVRDSWMPAGTTDQSLGRR